MTSSSHVRLVRSVVLAAVAGIAPVSAWVTVLSDPCYRATLVAFRLPGRRELPAPVPLDSAVAEARDPAPGSQPPDCAALTAIRHGLRPGAKGVLVAALGDCGSCCRLNLAKLYPHARRHGLAMAVFSDGTAADVQAYREGLHREGIDIPIVRDDGHRLTTALNAYYPGRLYWFTPTWRLRWREQDQKVDNYLFQTGRFDKIAGNTEP